MKKLHGKSQMMSSPISTAASQRAVPLDVSIRADALAVAEAGRLNQPAKPTAVTMIMNARAMMWWAV